MNMPTQCQRCHGAMTGGFTMSRFNTQWICGPCEADERTAPGYANAEAVELAQVKRGNYNFEGVGLSPADREYLARRRAKRSAPDAVPR